VRKGLIPERIRGFKRLFYKLGKSLLLCLLFIFPAALYSQSNGSPDSIIARVWLDQANKLLISEDFDQAAEALDIASEYESVPGSDALYLRGKLLVMDRSVGMAVSPIRRAYILLGESLDSHDENSSGSSNIIGFEERAVLWSSLALRLKEYRGILDRFSKWPRGNRDNPLLLYAAARSALYLGLNEKAIDLATKGESLSVPGAGGTDLQILGPGFPEGVEPGFRAIAIAAGDPRSINTMDAVWHRWPRTLEASIRPWILSGYIDVNNTGNLKNLLSLEMQNILLLMTRPDDVDMGDFQSGIKDLALLRRVRSKGAESTGQRIDSLLSDFTGALTSDSDYDGYPEEMVNFINGRLDKRTIDKDQDGSSEWIITYDGGRPSHILYMGGNGELSLIYDKPDYPALLMLIHQEENARTELSFNPGAFTWEAEKADGFWSEPLRPVEPEWNEETLWISTRSVKYSTMNLEHGYSGVTETNLAGGYPLRAVEEVYSDNEKKMKLWTREIIYEDGVAVAGRRSYRQEKENPGRQIWELYERYENGEMAGLAWDPGMSGSPLYLRDWALGRYLETQVWDLDSDGWMDVRRFLLPGGKEESRELMITEANVEDLLPWKSSDWSPWE